MSLFEHCLNMSATELFLLQQDSFDDKNLVEFLRQFEVHIYLICKSPRIKIDPELVEITDDIIKIGFYNEGRNGRVDWSIETVNRPDQRIKDFKCEYPFHEITFYQEGEIEYVSQKASTLLRILSSQQGLYAPLLDLEVVYVGQAFGEDGNRITADRLMKHEKAQRIYFDTMEKDPDKEVWLLNMVFEPSLISMNNLSAIISKEEFNSGWDHYEKIQETPLSKDQQITVVEACLINYFNTQQYNKEYLGTFPSPEHVKYQDCYELDFNNVSFEFETSTLWTQLWSKSVSPNDMHYGKFFLHDEKERKNMFEWYK